MSFWWEVWTRPGSATFGRLIEDLTYADASYHEGINQVGDGNASLPFDAPTSTLLDPSIPAGSLLRLIHDSDPDYPAGEWLPTQITPETDANDPTVEAAGVGMNSTLAYARLEPFDWDGADNFISRDPDWIYGGNDFAVNGGLEDNPHTIPNFGFEDGTIVPWWPGAVEGFSANASIVTGANVDTGTYAMGVTPLIAEGGASTTMTLWPANFYTVTARIKGVLGVDYEIGAQSSFETMVPNGGNSVLVGPLDSGGYEVQHTFTGTGAYETVVLVFGTAGDQRSAQLNIREAVPFNGGTFYVDEVTVTGFGAGASPWEPTGTQRPNVLGPVPQFEVSNTQAFTGTWSLFVEADPGHGAFQRFRGILNGVTYTATVAVGHASAASLWALEIRDVQGNLIAQDSATIATNAWTELQVTFRAPDFIPGADSELQVRVINYASAARTVFIDDLVMYRGNPPATIGQILSDIYDDATTNHAGRVVWEDFANPGNPWLILDFDGTNDSNGTPWPGPVEVRLPMRSSYSQIMADLSRQFGVEYRVILDPAQDGQWLWQVFLPQTMGTDLSADPNVAVLSGTTETMRGTAVRLPSATDVMVEGPDKITARDRDAGLIAGLGRIEASIWSRNAETPAEEADEYIDTVQTRLESYRVTVVDPDVVPFVDYKVGDIVWVEDPPISQAFRVMDIIAVLGSETNQFNVQFGSVFNTGEAAMAQAVAGLMPADPVHRPQGLFMPSPDRMLTAGSDRLQQLVGGGGGGQPTVVVAASNASDLSKSKADFICTGTNDEATIMAAMDIVDSVFNGGLVQLTEGRFICDPNTIVVSEQSWLRGVGEGTFIEAPSTNNTLAEWMVQVGGNGIGGGVGDLYILPKGRVAINGSGGVGRTISGVVTEVTSCAFQLVDGVEGWRIADNIVRQSTYFMIIDDVSGGIELVISGNRSASGGFVYLGNLVSSIITDNVFSGSLVADDARSLVIADNVWPQVSVSEGAVISLGQNNSGFSGIDPGCLVSGNIAPSVGQLFLEASGVEDLHVVNNRFAGGGVRLADLTLPIVALNRGLELFSHGVYLQNVDGAIVKANTMFLEDEFDGIRVEGDGNLIEGNRIEAVAGPPDSGINIVSGTGNIYVGNQAVGTYGTAEYIDGGTSSINTYPSAGGAQGDNFV